MMSITVVITEQLGDIILAWVLAAVITANTFIAIKAWGSPYSKSILASWIILARGAFLVRLPEAYSLDGFANFWDAFWPRAICYGVAALLIGFNVYEIVFPRIKHQ